MKILFPSEMLQPKLVEPMFEAERNAARDAGFETQILDSDALDADNLARALRGLPAIDSVETVLYRGWMLGVDAYARLYEALASRGYALINDPTQYRHAHHLPECYPLIREHTPLTVWASPDLAGSREQLAELLAPFGSGPLVVKDYVKSLKHHWNEACFIPSASDLDAAARVAARFVELQDVDLVGGLVFRAFVELEPLTTHSQSAMPLTKEFRVFYLRGHAFASAEYWEEGDYGGEMPPTELFADVAARIESNFFSIDVARRVTGEWIIIELGDGQVSGLPDRLDPSDFYEALASAALKFG